MGLFDGKKGMILGVANDFSIAWAISQKLLAEGAELGFTHLPGDKMERRVRKLADPIGAKLVTPCDVQKDEDVARVFEEARDDLRRRSTSCSTRSPSRRSKTSRSRSSSRSREGFKTAMDISVYSLASVSRHAAESMPDGGLDRHPDLFRRRAGRRGLQPDGRLQGGARHGGALPRLRPRPEEDPGQRRLRRPGQDARGLGRGRVRQARRAVRGGLADGPEHHPRGGRLGRACSCSPTWPAGSPARSSTSIAATTSWARPAAPSRRPRKASRSEPDATTRQTRPIRVGIGLVRRGRPVPDPPAARRVGDGRLLGVPRRQVRARRDARRGRRAASAWRRPAWPSSSGRSGGSITHRTRTPGSSCIIMTASRRDPDAEPDPASGFRLGRRRRSCRR